MPGGGCGRCLSRSAPSAIAFIHSFIHSFLLLDFFLYSLRLRGRLTIDMKTEASAAAVPFQGRSWLSCDWHSASADQSHATKVAFLTRFPNDVTT